MKQSRCTHRRCPGSSRCALRGRPSEQQSTHNHHGHIEDMRQTRKRARSVSHPVLCCGVLRVECPWLAKGCPPEGEPAARHRCHNALHSVELGSDLHRSTQRDPMKCSSTAGMQTDAHRRNRTPHLRVSERLQCQVVVRVRPGPEPRQGTAGTESAPFVPAARARAHALTQCRGLHHSTPNKESDRCERASTRPQDATSIYLQPPCAQ